MTHGPTLHVTMNCGRISQCANIAQCANNSWRQIQSLAKHQRRFAQLLVVSLISLVLLCAMIIAPINAHAHNSEPLAQPVQAPQTAVFFNTRVPGACGPYNVDGFGAYQNFHDSSKWGVAYCLDQFKNGPKTHMTYVRTDTPNQVLSYLVAFGYPNTTTICGRTLTDGEARAVTQLAVWQYRDGKVLEQNANLNGLRTLALQFLDQAKNYSGPPFNCGSVWHPQNADAQDILLTAQSNKGWLSIKKSSAVPIISNENQNYSLAGARYVISKDPKGHEVVGELTTKEDGSTDTIELPCGHYFIIEKNAPQGFSIDTKAHEITIGVLQKQQVELKDDPIVVRPPLTIEKYDNDLEIHAHTAQGNAQLEGSRFELKYYSGSYKNVADLPKTHQRRWVLQTRVQKNGHIAARLGSSSCFLTGDPLFVDPTTGAPLLPIGTYSIKEIRAPQGYMPVQEEVLIFVVHANSQDNSSKQLKVGDAAISVIQAPKSTELSLANEALQLAVPNKVMRGGLRIKKRDADSAHGQKLGGATLEEARFSLFNDSQHDVVVKQKRYTPGAEIDCLSLVTLSDGSVTTERDILPFGSYRVKEVQAPRGYLLAHDSEFKIEIQKQNQLIELDVADPVMRGDVKLVKCASDTSKALAHVPFRLTCLETGESHIVITDDQGVFDSSSNHIAHSYKTNQLDEHQDSFELPGHSFEPSGIWFSGSSKEAVAVDDTRGALPYGNYRLEELAASSNADYELVQLEFSITRDSYCIDLGKVDDKHKPKIETSVLTDETAKQQSSAKQLSDKQATDKQSASSHSLASDHSMAKIFGETETYIIDRVTYSYLQAGKVYHLKGRLIDKATGKAVSDTQGKELVVEHEFKAAESFGFEDVRFKLNAQELVGKQFVVFETLWLEQEKIATHEDINSEAQTLEVVPPKEYLIPKTSDIDLPIVFFVSGALSCFGLAFILQYLRKRSK